jgi:hypothetical protein
MERARATWTDERLDDLARRVDDGFTRVDQELRTLRTDLGGRIDAQGAELSARIDAQGARIDAQGTDLAARIDAQGARIDAQGTDLAARIDAQGAELGARIDALQRTMLQVGGATIATVLATLASVVVTQL